MKQSKTNQKLKIKPGKINQKIKIKPSKNKLKIKPNKNSLKIQGVRKNVKFILFLQLPMTNLTRMRKKTYSTLRVILSIKKKL